jgi:hypothetical protein
MNTKRLDQCLRKKVALMAALAPVIVCAFAMVSNSAAQSVSAVTASAPATPEHDKLKVKFNTPKIPAPKAGVPTAYNLCNGQAIPVPAGFTDADGMKMDTSLAPCGEQSSSTGQVSGGNPPYHFQWETGSFPPLGMHVGMNGLLYGTPAPPPLGGYKPFTVCAVDTSANPDCHEVQIASQPAPTVKAHSSAAPIVLGVLAAGGVAAVVGAKEMSNSSTSGSGTEAGTCSGLAPANACGACSCTDNGTCNNPSSQCGGDVCYWAGPGTAAGQAPFCGNGH